MTWLIIGLVVTSAWSVTSFAAMALALRRRRRAPNPPRLQALVWIVGTFTLLSCVVVSLVALRESTVLELSYAWFLGPNERGMVLSPIGVLAGLALFGLARLVLRAPRSAPQTQPRPPARRSASWDATSPTTWPILGAVVVAEEVVWRGFYIPAMAALTGSAGLAVSAASVLYGMSHRARGNAAVILHTFTGVIYGLLYVSSQSVVLPLAAHVSFNAAVMVSTRAHPHG